MSDDTEDREVTLITFYLREDGTIGARVHQAMLDPVDADVVRAVVDACAEQMVELKARLPMLVAGEGH